MQAAFLRVKLRRLDDWNERRCKIAGFYLRELSQLNSSLLNVSEFQLLPQVSSWANPVWHLFVIRYPQRDALQKKLTEAGIGTLIHYPVPAHLSKAYAHSESRAAGKLPIAEELAASVLSLPIGPHVSEEMAASVVREVKTALATL
jgi:dTDP-4-amino-4,6-dideoxygalactose transaminase